ncbi:unnamed protein product, partial [marine sediment metagenome]
NFKRSNFPETYDNLSISDKINLFVDRIKNKILVPADKMVNGYENLDSIFIPSIENSNYATLSIISQYFEMYGKYHEGYCDDFKAGEYFRKGFDLIADELGWFGAPKLGETQVSAINGFFKQRTGEELNLTVEGLGESTLSETFYNEIRCGLYHIGQVGQNIRISDLPTAFIMMQIPERNTVQSLHVNPRFLVKELLKHIQLYEKKLQGQSETELLENFIKRFDYDNEKRF